MQLITLTRTKDFHLDDCVPAICVVCGRVGEALVGRQWRGDVSGTSSKAGSCVHSWQTRAGGGDVREGGRDGGLKLYTYIDGDSI